MFERVDRGLRPAALFLGDAQVEPGVALLGTGFEQQRADNARQARVAAGAMASAARSASTGGALPSTRAARLDQRCAAFEDGRPDAGCLRQDRVPGDCPGVAEDGFAAGERCVRVGGGLARDLLQHQHGVGRRAHEPQLIEQLKATTMRGRSP